MHPFRTQLIPPYDKAIFLEFTIKITFKKINVNMRIIKNIIILKTSQYYL
ncbi:hypothetical protein BDD26_2550 [Xenorhabdus cabanillasii]|uniref:Uncharacterized protein n=1 Tax=Xenorhabdus cabanillasii TaxID=351673 RepID=A0A3D9UP13_9GAMM|nr:hypothetical protein BDD26_2550 [Xenorhabdus cabanillasii]